MKITTFDCPKCSAPLEVEPGKTTLLCKYCGNSVVIPEELRTGVVEEAPVPQFRQAPQVVINASAYNPYRTSRGPGCAIGGIVAAVACLILVGALVPILGATALMANLESATGIDWDGSGSTSGGDPAAIFGEGVEIPGVGSAGGSNTLLRFGSEGIGQGQFEDARHIGVDGEGNIYVGEYMNGRIQVFDADGNFLKLWTVDDEFPLTGMAVASDGTVYLVQQGLIHRYEGMTGKALGEVSYGGGWGFDDLVIAPDGSLIASWYVNRDDIVRFDAQGAQSLVISEAISGVSGDSELNTHVAVDGLGNIYALGTFNYAVFVYSPNGEFRNRFGSEGDEAGQFTAPSAITVDGQGRVYVLDIFGIKVYRNDGQYLSTIATSGPTYGINAQGDALYVAAGDHVEKLALPQE